MDRSGLTTKFCNKENEISLSEWKDALWSVQKNDPGMTITELSDLLGVSRNTVRGRIKNGIKNKTISCGTAIRRNQLCNVYQILKKGNK